MMSPTVKSLPPTWASSSLLILLLATSVHLIEAQIIAPPPTLPLAAAIDSPLPLVAPAITPALAPAVVPSIPSVPLVSPAVTVPAIAPVEAAGIAVAPIVPATIIPTPTRVPSIAVAPVPAVPALPLPLASATTTALTPSALETALKSTPHETSLKIKQVAPGSAVGPKLTDAKNTRESGAGTLNIIKARGFIGERYATKSKDGTPLTLYHIINPLANPRTLNRNPVLMFHGLGGDTSQMIAHSRKAIPRKPVLGQLRVDPSDESLIFMLANNNFDPWLIEGRGTTLNDHEVEVDINPLKATQYWNFTLDEQAHLDLPTAVDFVLAQTQEHKLHYIGFSESTYFMFAHLAADPGFQSKLASVTALAPVAYVSNIKGIGMPLFSMLSTVPDTISFNYLPQPLVDTLGTTLRTVCTNPLLIQLYCNPLSRAFVGGGEPQDASSFFTTALRSTSMKAFKHFLQQNIQKRFGMYDHGMEGNMAKYGQPRPPSYDLGKITLPTLILVRGGNDFLSDPEDQVRLLKELGVKPYMDLFLPHYNHLDFLVNRNMLHDMNIPIAKALFAITLKLSPNKSVLRDPTKPVVRVVPPVEVAQPDGSREVKIQSHLLSNTIEGAMQAMGPYSSRLFPQLGLLRRLSQQFDKFGTKLNTIPGTLMHNNQL